MVEARLSRFIEQYKEMLQFQNNITQKYKEQLLIGTNNLPTSENKIVQLLFDRNQRCHYYPI
jgi:hypothetical protein